MNFGSDFDIGASDCAATAMSELLAVGPLASFLVKGPTISFWRYRYSRYGNFVLITTPMAFENTPKFGEQIRARLTQTSAELLYQLWFVATLPGIHAVRKRSRVNDFPYNASKIVRKADRAAFHDIGSMYADADSDDNKTALGRAEFRLRNYGEASQFHSSCHNDDNSTSTSANTSSNGNGEVWAHWANAIGYVLIKRAVLLVGTYPADMLVRESMYMWEELAGKAGRRLKEHIGKARTRRQLIDASASDQTVYVPFPFYFSKSSGSAYVYVAAKSSPIDLIVELESLAKCIVKSDKDVAVLKSASGNRISNDDIKAHISATVVFVSQLEKEQFEESNFDQLMTQTQVTSTKQKGKEKFGIPLRFTHPVIELMWCIRRAVHERTNDWFNFSGLDGREPVKTFALRYDNRLRFHGEHASYYRLVTPYQAGHNVPKAFIYNFSFAIDAEEGNPNGTSTPSVFRDVDLFLELQPGLERETTTAFVACISFNIMRYREGEISAPLFR